MSKKIGFFLAFILTIFFGYNLISQIFTTLKQADKLQLATETLYNLEVKNKELKEKLSWVKSREFVEKEARDKLGLSKEGETVVVIPNNKISQVLGSEKVENKVKLPNWQGWWQLFF